MWGQQIINQWCVGIMYTLNTMPAPDTGCHGMSVRVIASAVIPLHFNPFIGVLLCVVVCCVVVLLPVGIV